MSKTQLKTNSSPQNSRPSESSSKKTRKNTSSQLCNLCGITRHAESKCWHKLEALNEGMQQHKILVSKPSSIGKGNALSSQALYIYQWIHGYLILVHLTISRVVMSFFL